MRVPLSKEFPRGRLDGREPLSLSLGFSPLLDRVPFRTHLIESMHAPVVIHCARSPLFLFPLPLDLPLAAAAPEAGLSCRLSREEKCFSRFFSVPSIGPSFFLSRVRSRDSPVCTVS